MPLWHSPMPRPPGSLNYYRREMRRQDARQRAALAIVIEQLTFARERLQAALRQLEFGRLA